jgi:hypothetical protein
MTDEEREQQRVNKWRARRVHECRVLKLTPPDFGNMTAAEREKQRVSQWGALKQVRPRFKSWLKDKSWRKKFHQLEFIPHSTFLEIFIFYKTDADVAAGNTDGFSETIRQKMLGDLADLEYPRLAETEVRFIFDSHENVVKNYEGSYFYRLR